MYRVVILVASDSGYEGKRKDASGPYLEQLMKESGYIVKEVVVLPDEEAVLAQAMRDIADEDRADLILTSGGTGLSLRDRTPEATLQVIDRQVAGIPEAMRAYSMQFTKRAMFSRGIAGTRKQTLIINLPGSPKAVAECMEAILSQLDHALGILRGSVTECART